MIHELKTIQPYYSQVKNGRKTFELRKNDRDFKIGDLLFLQEYVKGKLTGKSVVKRITYILADAGDFGLKDGYVILGIK